MPSVNLAHEQLLIQGYFRRAIEVFESEWTADVKNRGPDRPETVRTEVRYADVLHMAGEYDIAAKMYHEILLKMKGLPQHFHDEVLDVKLSLVNIYKNNVNEATASIEELEEFIARMPMDDTKIALKRKLATTLCDLGRYESALQYFEEIYHFKCNNDPHNIDTLSSHVDIATVFVEQGRYNKAMDILKSVHEEACKIHPNHPCTLKAQRYISDICVHYGLTMIACMKYEQIVQIQEEEAPRSLDNLITLHKLSLAYFKDGRTTKALKLIEGVYNARKVETPSHPDTVRVEIDFIMMHLQEENYPQATSLLIMALERMSDCFEFEYSLLVDIPRNIAAFLRNLRKSDKAEQAIKIYESLHHKQCQMVRLGPHHPETLNTKTHIAETHLYLNNVDEALKIFEEVLHIKLDVLKNDSMDCLDVRKHIADIYLSRKEYEKSFYHYCEVYRNEKMYLGGYHDVTIDTEDIVDSFCLKEPGTNLLKAIIANDIQSVKNFIDAPEKTDLDSQDCYGCTPLHVAVRVGNAKIIRLLLSKGASLYVKNKYGKIPRELARTNEVKSIFNIISQLFMDVKLGNRKDVTEVLSFEDGDIINILDEEGKTMLLWACQKGDLETVKLLLSKGADPRVKDQSGVSCVDIAKRFQHDDIVQTLQKHLDDPSLRALYMSSSKRSPGRSPGGDGS